MGVWNKALKGIVITSMLGGLMFSNGQGASAENAYTYKDEVSSFSINGSPVRMSGEHVVWRGKGADGSGPGGQIHYGNVKSGLMVAVTDHGRPADTPAIGMNAQGEAIVVWVDRRNYQEGATDMNWDIYSYNVTTNTESKINDTVGQHKAPSIDGNYIVWQTNPSYEMHLYDMESGALTELGNGRNPVIGNGRIVYKGAEDGDLYAYEIAGGSHQKILELPFSQYVERFVFNGEQILWKQKDLDGNSKYTFMDLGESNSQPVDLTEPAKPEAEYKHMSISNGTAVWLEKSGDEVIMKGADLNSGDVFSLGATRPRDFVGFNGNELTLVQDGNLNIRTIIQTEGGSSQPAGNSSNADSDRQSESVVIGPDGGKVAVGESAWLSFEQGTFEAKTRVVLESHSDSDLGTKGKQVKGMTWTGIAWKWTAETELMKPAMLTIALASPLETADLANRTGVYRYDEAEDRWVYAGGTVDAAWQTVDVPVKHPGMYALFTYEPSFTDMNGHWARQEVEVLAARWIVNGMATGNFKPKQSVTRAQFAKMLVEAAGLTEEIRDAGTFKDVPAGHWAAPWVEQAAAAGWIKGYEGGMFKPNAEVTREEMMVMLANAAGLKRDESGNVIADYADSGQVSSWARPSVEAVIRSGIVQGGGGRIHPGDTSTRAEAAAVIYRWLTMKGEVFNG
ncbi:S-layer homology domain-containing protein [Paenibacillus chungangensis]|uniref:S-layer homology domain-containing protein n=1 Tax=Paenibacillus chungangensis TaxID=696535 RepID=A0ABW3HPD9_9BACL